MAQTLYTLPTTPMMMMKHRNTYMSKGGQERGRAVVVLKVNLKKRMRKVTTNRVEAHELLRKYPTLPMMIVISEKRKCRLQDLTTIIVAQVGLSVSSPKRYEEAPSQPTGVFAQDLTNTTLTT